MFNCFTSHLTAGLRVCVHSWAEGGGGAGELGVRSLRQAGVVLAGVAGHSVLVVVGLVVRLWVIRCWSWVVGGLGVIWSWGWVVRRLWRMVGSWFMIGGSGGNVWSWGRLVICRYWSYIWSWSWFMVDRSVRRAVWSRGVWSGGGGGVLPLGSHLLTDSLHWEVVEGGEVVSGHQGQHWEEGEGEPLHVDWLSGEQELSCDGVPSPLPLHGTDRPSLWCLNNTQTDAAPSHAEILGLLCRFPASCCSC